MNVIFTPVYNRKNKFNKDGKAPVEIRVYHNRQRKFLGTGVSILPEEWDQKKLQVNKKNPFSIELNEKINSSNITDRQMML